MEKKSCLMCGKNKDEVIHTFDSTHNPRIKDLKIVRCKSCGFAYMNPQLELKELTTLYPQSLHESKRKSKLKFLKKYYERIRLKHVLKEARKDSKNILDVGCSNGFFLELAKKKGMDIYGTEFGKKQVAYLRKHVTNNAYTSEKELIGKVKFDIITAFDVIEHLRNPEEFIRNCSKLLKKDGLLVIMTVVLDSWTYKVFKGRVMWIADQHLFYFTREQLAKLLKKYGLEIYKTKTYNKSLLHATQFVYQGLIKKRFSFADEIIFFIKPKNASRGKHTR